MKPLYQVLASLVRAIKNCEKSNNTEWLVKHKDRLTKLCGKHLPHGSGINAGAEVDPDASSPDKLVILTSFHHMDENGYYDGWTDYKVIVTPSLAFGMNVKIVGKDKNHIKEYLHETFEYSLNNLIEEFE